MNENLLQNTDVDYSHLKNKGISKHSQFLMLVCMSIEDFEETNPDCSEHVLLRNFFAYQSLLEQFSNVHDNTLIASVFENTCFGPHLDYLTTTYKSIVPSKEDVFPPMVANGGFSGFYPENSQESIVAALNYGIQYIKVKVIWSSIRACFIIHSTNEPLLKFLHSFHHTCTLYIEWYSRTQDASCVCAYISILKSAPSNITIKTILANHIIMCEFRNLNKQFSLGYTTCNVHQDYYRSLIDSFQLEFIVLDLLSICPDSVREIQSNSTEVYVTHTNSLSEKLFAKHCNVNFIITDFPLKHL